jgi:hypothetical protein
LCEISSDLSAADEKKFVEKNKNFWAMKKHYFKIEYSVQVLIGPADIRFELWFDDQKLSCDQAIKAEWTSTQAPTKAEMPEVRSDILKRGLVELPGSQPVRDEGQSVTGSDHNGKMECSNTATKTQETSPDRTGKMRRGMGGLLAKAKGGGKRTAIR